MKIMARCSAEDKFVFVAGIKQKGGLIAMTGDSIGDAEALMKADVGLCMGSGCDVAKDNSDLIIDDNNFESIHKAIKWGRALFDNVRKFIQFQMTMNLSICFITIIGGLTLGRPPLNIVQMLWVNLIMDVLGAIAIATEPYNNHSTTQRVSRDIKKNPLM
jgi:Ca2+-transporting ATPase